MEKILIYSGASIIAAMVMVVLVLAAPLCYALGGFITGWVLVIIFPFAGNWIMSGASSLGVEITLEMLPHIGAALGFTGSFFRARQTNNNKGDK